MTNQSLNKTLENLKIDTAIIKKLNDNNIYEVKNLWNLNRQNLKELNLTDPEIKHLIIKLQLHGIDLGKKIYNRN